MSINLSCIRISGITYRYFIECYAHGSGLAVTYKYKGQTGPSAAQATP